MFDWLTTRKQAVPLKNFFRTIFFLAPCLGVLVGSGCDELLPPRDNPKILFKGDITCYYIYSTTENDCIFFVDVTNIYHETIQDTAAVQGTIEVTLKRDPQYHKTIRLSLQNFHGPFVYDSLKNLFTIDPGKKAIFSAAWNFIDDNQVDLTTVIFRYLEDPACEARFKSQTETFIVKGSIRIISGGEIVPFGPKEFQTFSITPSFIVDKDCPPYP
jgi:hypothetical protein